MGTGTQDWRGINGTRAGTILDYVSIGTSDLSKSTVTGDIVYHIYSSLVVPRDVISRIIGSAMASRLVKVEIQAEGHGNLGETGLQRLDGDHFIHSSADEGEDSCSSLLPLTGSSLHSRQQLSFYGVRGAVGSLFR